MTEDAFMVIPEGLDDLSATEGVAIIGVRAIESSGNGHYRTTSSDPHIIFSLSSYTPTRDRQMLIRLEALPVSELLQGAIYWDIGYGFNENDKLTFDYDKSGITWVYVEGIAEAASFRWDPSDKCSIEFLVKSIRFFTFPDITQYLFYLGINHWFNIDPLKFALMIEVDREARPSEIRLTDAFSEFDSAYYLDMYPDVSRAGVDPLDHYLKFGWIEGRSPSPHFQVGHWLASNESFRKAALFACGCLPRNLAKAPNYKGVTIKPKLDRNHRDLLSVSRRQAILFIGYFEASLGLGDAARGTIKALTNSQLPFSIYPFNRNVEDRFQHKFEAHLYDQYFPYIINVFEMSADQLPLALDELGSWRVQGSYNVFRAYWELADAPESWRTILLCFDEIWAPSTFVANSFKKVFDGEIYIIPPFVDVGRHVSFSRNHYGINPKRFYFLTSFDILSGTARKNPLAVLEAFNHAFPTEPEVGLIIKCVGSEKLEDAMIDEIRRLSSADERIVFMRKTLSRDEIISLIEISDCYVSLHRSEGFGLGLAEAMLLQKPVIATDYSGSADFIRIDNGYPVEFSLRPVKKHEYILSSDQQWAEPSIESASGHMLRVFNDAPDRAKRALAASLFIKQRFGAENVCLEIEKRASEIFRRILPPTFD